MKKICFVTTVYMTYRYFLKELSKYLYQTGEYDISLICAEEKGLREDLPDFIHFHPVAMKRGVTLSGLSAIVQMQQIFRQEQFDIVQYSTPNAAFYASIAAKQAGVPVRLYCQWGIRYMGFTGWRRGVFKAVEKITCSNSTFIEAESHNIRSFSLKEGLYTEEKSCVIWNGSACGVDLARFDIRYKEQWREQIRSQLQIPREAVVFAFAARLTADKGINELLRAFLAIQQPNASLLVMGGMDDTTALDTELMAQAQACPRVIFTGNVEGIEKYYAAADVFVAPSYREGFGLVVVEAEAMGLPAIVSNVPGQIDAIEDGVTGLSCRVKDAASLEQKMRMLLADDALRETMGKEARRFAENGFEQHQLFKKLMHHRDELIGGKMRCRELVS